MDHIYKSISPCKNIFQGTTNKMYSHWDLNLGKRFFCPTYQAGWCSLCSLIDSWAGLILSLVLVWVLPKADAKTGLDVQGLY